MVAIITISDKLEVLATTNGVSPFIILNALRGLDQAMCKIISTSAKEIVGDNALAQEKWIDEQSKKIFSIDEQPNIRLN